jgi:hypothetical protein
MGEIEQVFDCDQAIYVLYQEVDVAGTVMDVVHIGACSGNEGDVKNCLIHHRSRGDISWSHFSVFAFREWVPTKDIKELAGLFRHIYRKDLYARSASVAKAYKPLSRIKNRKVIDDWPF